MQLHLSCHITCHLLQAKKMRRNVNFCITHCISSSSSGSVCAIVLNTMESKTPFLLLTLLTLTGKVFGSELLMISGGYYYHDGDYADLRSVEVVTTNQSCEVSALPEPRFGHGMARMKHRIIACGGFYGQERTECFTYFPRQMRWETNFFLPEPLMHHGQVGSKHSLYVAGGRRFNHTSQTWQYSSRVWKYHTVTGSWTSLPSLPKPMADGCLLVLSDNLVFIGGSSGKFRYSDDPSKVWVLLEGDSKWRDDIIPPLLAQRMWQACVVVRLDGQVGILVAGGYYNGKATMFFPLMGQILNKRMSGDWKWLGTLPEERKWNAALGRINGVPAIAAGGDYGDDSIDFYDSYRQVWITSKDLTLKRKREFSSHVTVPRKWFPNCF